MNNAVFFLFQLFLSDFFPLFFCEILCFLSRFREVGEDFKRRVDLTMVNFMNGKSNRGQLKEVNECVISKLRVC